VEQADLVSYGMFGLIDALGKFEPGRGNKFETYAIPRIKGAIIDELRAMDWVPRSVRFKAREIEKAHADLESMLKRAPTEREMAERLGVSLSELHDVTSQISFVSVLALDELLSVGSDRGEQVSLLDTLADRGGDIATGLEGQETRGLLAAAINSLSEREKIVVTL
jgi:RNA polymerase sigma factor for flagellar operon FliA